MEYSAGVPLSRIRITETSDVRLGAVNDEGALLDNLTIREGGLIDAWTETSRPGPSLLITHAVIYVRPVPTGIFSSLILYWDVTVGRVFLSDVQ